MTLISKIDVKRIPFFLSDTLVTSIFDFEEYSSNPSVAHVDLTHSKNGERYISGNIQKSTIINNNWLVMVSGDLIIGSIFTQKIYDLLKDQKKKTFKDQISDINVFIDENQTLKIHPENEYSREFPIPKYIICGVNLKNKEFFFKNSFRNNIPQINSNIYDKIICFGSGTNDLYDTFSNMGKNGNELLNTNINSDYLQKMEKNVGYILDIMINMYCLDFLPNHPSLNNYYGGLYEIICPDITGFKKLSGYKILIWDIDDKDMYLKQILEINYQEQYLVVTVIEYDLVEKIELDQNEHIKPVNALRFEEIKIPPIYSKIPKIDQKFDIHLLINLFFTYDRNVFKEINHLTIYNESIYNMINVKDGAINLDFFSIMYHSWERLKKK